MPAMGNRSEIENKGDHLLQLVEAHRAAPAGSPRERQMEATLEQTLQVMAREPETTAAVALFLANFISAMNESLPPRKRMWPGPRAGSGQGAQHQAPGAR